MKKGELFERIKISDKELENLKKLEKKAVSAKILRRIQMLKLINLNWKYKAIADFLGVRKDTISSWIKIYKDGGTLKLLQLNYKGRTRKLNNNQLKELKERASQGEFKFAKEIKDYIQTNFNLSYHLNHVQKIAKKNFDYPLRKQN